MKTIKQHLQELHSRKENELQQYLNRRRAFKPLLKAINNMRVNYPTGKVTSVSVSCYSTLLVSIYITARDIPPLMTELFTYFDRKGIPIEKWQSANENGVVSYDTRAFRTYLGDDYSAAIYINVIPDETVPGTCRKVIIGHRERTSTVREPIYEVRCGD